MSKKIEKLSKFLSLVLRHKPEQIGIALDEHGWANVNELIAGFNGSGREMTAEILAEIVATDNKQRYSYNDDKTLIRANQGHSIPVDVELKEMDPPPFLYHGTAMRFVAQIMQEGLKPMGRLYVHLSKDIATARNVGKRHGSPAILKVDSSQMAVNGSKFYLSENGVWLTKYVDPKYLEVIYEQNNNV